MTYKTDAIDIAFMDGRGKLRESFRNLCGIQKGRFKGWALVGLAKTLASEYRISAVRRIKRTLLPLLLRMGGKGRVIPQPMRNPEKPDNSEGII